MGIDHVSSKTPATGAGAGAGFVVARELPPPPEIGAVELEHAERWLKELGLLKHPSTAFLSPPARMALARIGIMKRELASHLLDNRAMKLMRYGPTGRRDAPNHILELTELLVRRGIDVRPYVKDHGLLSHETTVLRGTMAEMEQAARVAELEAGFGRHVAVRRLYDVPWHLIPVAYLNALRERYPELGGLYIDGGKYQPISEVDYVVSGSRLGEVKERSRGQKMEVRTTSLSRGDNYQEALNTAKLFAIASKNHLDVEYDLSMSAMDEEWAEGIAELAKTMKVGLTIVLYPKDGGEPQLLLNTATRTAIRGAAILFGTPGLPPLPEPTEGPSAEERAWLAQWIPDAGARAKAAAKSRFFFEQALPKYAGVIASGIAEALTIHYEALRLFHLFDTDGLHLLRQARFLEKNAGPTATPELLAHLVAVGRVAREQTAGDEDLAQTLAHLQGYRLRDEAELVALGLSASQLQRIEAFIQTAVPAEARARLQQTFAGATAPRRLFNLDLLLEMRRSTMPRDLVWGIEGALPPLPAWSDHLAAISRRFSALGRRYHRLSEGPQRGHIKHRYGRIVQILKQARARTAGDLDLLDLRIDEFEEELAELEARRRPFTGVVDAGEATATRGATTGEDPAGAAAPDAAAEETTSGTEPKGSGGPVVAPTPPSSLPR